MGCIASKSTISACDGDNTVLGLDDVHERPDTNCHNIPSDLLDESKRNISKKVSRCLLPNATMNMKQGQASPLDQKISRMAEDYLKTRMGYNKKYKQMEVGSKPFKLKEVKLAGFAIDSCAKTIVSDDGMDRFISEWVQHDDIDKKKLKGLGNVSKARVRSLSYMIRNEENETKPMTTTKIKEKAEAIYQERQAKKRSK